MHTFAKIVDHPDTQIVVMRCTNEEDEPAVSVTFEGRMGRATMTFGFENDEDADKAFENGTDDEWCQFVDQQHKMLFGGFCGSEDTDYDGEDEDFGEDDEWEDDDDEY